MKMKCVSRIMTWKRTNQMADKKKIFIFINTRYPDGDVIPIALCEDGHCLGSHMCSREGWISHDMGISSEWKHKNYNEHCGKGNWELIYVEEKNVKGHLGIDAAYKLNQEIGEKVKEAQL